MSKKGDPSNKRTRETDDIDVVVDDNNPPLTIPHIQERIRQLLAKLPSKDETAALTVMDLPAMENWCRTVRAVLRNYNLTLNFVAIANYQWEPVSSRRLSMRWGCLDLERDAHFTFLHPHPSCFFRPGSAGSHRTEPRRIAQSDIAQHRSGEHRV